MNDATSTANDPQASTQQPANVQTPQVIEPQPGDVREFPLPPSKLTPEHMILSLLTRIEALEKEVNARVANLRKIFPHV